MKKFYAIIMLAAALTACTLEELPQTIDNPDAIKTYTMTIEAAKGNTVTKALDLSGKTITPKWAATDEVSVFPESWATPAMGTLTAAASETGSTTLTGAVTGAAEGNTLNLLFPRAEWSYTGQKGILLSDENSIEKKYDYAAAQVTVSKVDGTTITTNTANFTSQQAIVKFTLQDKDGNAINATSLNISASSNKLVKNKSYRGAGTKTYYYGDGYYTVTAGSGGYNTSEKHNSLVDNKLGTKWCQDKPDGGWYIEFHTASPIQVDGYMLRTGDDTGSWGQWTRNPQDWVLKGKKNSGDSWTDIDTKSEYSDMPNTSNTEKDFDVDVPGEYQYFRLEISNNRGNGGIMQLSEMRLFSYEYYEMGTTYGGLTVTPASATNEMTVALRNENASADTYTLTATVGGATYNYTKSGVTFENGKYYAITVKMNPKKVSSISLNKTSASLAIGGTVELSVSNVSPSDAVDKTVTWSSSNSSFASVNATGVVTAVAEGTATITATANDGSGKTATCSVTVYPAGTIVWDSSNCSSMSLYGGDSYNDNTTIAGINLKCNANQVDASWYSYDGGIGFRAYATGGYTFTAPTGKTFTKIEMIAKGSSDWDDAIIQGKLGTGWPSGNEAAMAFQSSKKITWTGDASTTVNLLTDDDHFNGSAITSIAFFVSE